MCLCMFVCAHVCGCSITKGGANRVTVKCYDDEENLLFLKEEYIGF